MFDDSLICGRCFVFQEIQVNGQTFFLHFKKCEDDYDIIPDVLLNPIEHRQLMAYD